MKKMTIFSFFIILISHGHVSHANSCGTSRPSVSIINYYHTFSSLMSSPQEVDKVSSQAELNELSKSIDYNLSFIVRNFQDRFQGCLSTTNGKAFIQTIANKELEAKHGQSSAGFFSKHREFNDWMQSGSKVTPINQISSAQDLIDKALAKGNEAKALIPEAQARIKLASDARQKKIEDQQKANELARKKLEQEQKQIAELEESIRQERSIQAQLEEAEMRRQKLEIENSNYHTQVPRKSRPENVNSKSGDGYIKDQGVFCLSEASFDRQVEYLARGHMSYASGCYSTPARQSVWLKDTSWNGTCILERVSDEREIWTFCEDYESW